MEWHRRWFGEEYLLVYERRDRDEACRDVRFITRTLDLQGGERVLDLCCGPGRHSIPLAELGCRVIGLDYSLPLLRIARAEAEGCATPPRFVRADARSIPLRDGVFDAVLNLFTSFGYFDDRANSNLLCDISRLLRPGGVYYIDYLNPPRVLAGLVPESTRERDGVSIREQRRVTGSRVEKTITIRRGGREDVFTESVRLYTLDEMREMLANAGLSVERVFGSSEGNAYSECSPRIILWGKKN